MEPLRIGVLGAARISASSIYAPAHETGHRLVAIAARDRGRAQEHADANGIERVLDSYQAVIDDPEVEAIYNPLANGLHGPWNLRAIAAGKHVLSEKPFTANADEARLVRDAAKRAGVVAMDALHYRYHPLISRMLEVIAAGEIGEVIHVESRMCISAPDATDCRWDLALAGGALMDLGVYALHIQRTLGTLLGGEPQVTSAVAREWPLAPGVDAMAAVQLAFPNGATGTAVCDMDDHDWDMAVRIHGTRGRIFLPNHCIAHQAEYLEITRGTERVQEPVTTRPTYAFQLEAFAAAVRQGVRPLTDADDAVRTMECIDAAYRAAGMQPRPVTMI